LVGVGRPKVVAVSGDIKLRQDGEPYVSEISVSSMPRFEYPLRGRALRRAGELEVKIHLKPPAPDQRFGKTDPMLDVAMRIF
jgi:hypothetical protein